MTEGSTVLALLLSVIAVLLGVVVRQMHGLAEKLDGKVSEPICQERHGQSVADGRELWEALNRHGHVGLPPDSKVIR